MMILILRVLDGIMYVDFMVGALGWHCLEAWCEILILTLDAATYLDAVVTRLLR